MDPSKLTTLLPARFAFQDPADDQQAKEAECYASDETFPIVGQKIPDFGWKRRFGFICSLLHFLAPIGEAVRLGADRMSGRQPKNTWIDFSARIHIHLPESIICTIAN